MRTVAVTLALLFLLPITIRAETRAFWTANLMMAAATVYDVETTMRAVHHGQVEANPVIRPLLSSRTKVYSFELGVDLAVALWSHKMIHAKHRFWPQIALIGTHGVIGTVNLTWGR